MGVVPLCALPGPLQFNPFFAAADDYAEALRAGERKKAE